MSVSQMTPMNTDLERLSDVSKVRPTFWSR